jgi:putative FmdB family regulatory protein
MPIYDYVCRACGHEFEALTRGSSSKLPKCPECQSEDAERMLSMPRVKSETTKGLAMRAAKRRDAQQASDRTRAQREYEASHED